MDSELSHLKHFSGNKALTRTKSLSNKSQEDADEENEEHSADEEVDISCVE